MNFVFFLFKNGFENIIFFINKLIDCVNYVVRSECGKLVFSFVVSIGKFVVGLN